MSDLENLGRRIREARQRKRLTQIGLALRIHHADGSTISRIESGQKYPDLETLCSVAEALGTTASELLDPDYVTNGANNRELLTLVKRILFLLEKKLNLK